MDMKRKVELLKEVLKLIHRGENVENVKKKFRDILAHISPFEIPLVEQELVKEGVPIKDILKLCDLHVELFREFLVSRQLVGVPKGHPIDVLMKENEYILKRAEALGLYANALINSKSIDESIKHIGVLKTIVKELKNIRIHYRKIQMLIFPYLERRGIIAVPRVLWGREDQVLTKIRSLNEMLSGNDVESLINKSKYIAEKALEIAKELSELVFRENKILFPAVWAMFSEGEWAAIKEISKDIGYLIEVEEEWMPKEKPILPYEVEEAIVSAEQLERLPSEMKSIVARGIEPDMYRIKTSNDYDLGTGFLNLNEIKAILNSLPIEITYANRDDRVKFYTHSKLVKGFIRTKTIIGRKVEYCHPPRLENLVRKVIDELKEGRRDLAEFWTKQGDRIIKVLIVAVRNDRGEYLGTIEIVEDLTEVIKNPEAIMKKIMIL